MAILSLFGTAKMKKIFKELHTPVWLLSLLIALLILRIPSFFEPYSYGDEMIYLTLGKAIRRGVPLYKGVHDNKPPLLYILAAISGSLFWFKVILAIWSLVTVFVFWKLTKALFPQNTKLQKVATLIFGILTTIPLLEGNIINAELFMIGPIILGFLILLTKKLSNKNIFISGILFSIATLFKVPAAFDIPAIIIFWLCTMPLNKKGIKTIGKNTLILALGFATPIAITFVWYFLRGAFKEYLIAAFLQNFGYLSSWRPSETSKPFLVKNAPLLLRAGIVFLGNLILFWKRKRLSRQFILITSWLLFSLFAVTLSERPYPHYLIQSVGPIAFLFAMLFTLKNFEQILSIVPLTLFSFVPVYFHFWYYPTSSYYVRFIKLATGRITKDTYLSSFGRNVQNNYKIAEFVSNSSWKEDKIFVWGEDSSTIYALTKRLPPGKYVATYHIKDFSTPDELLATLMKDPPKFIIILPNSDPPVNLIFFVKTFYKHIETFGGAQIWSRPSPVK